jgi:polysaccharide biosynthesis/export protein
MKGLAKLSPARRLAILAWFGLLAVCVQVNAQSMRLQVNAQSMREVLGPGDSVRITVFRYPDLTTEARLSEEGKLTMPLVGELALTGMSPDDAGKHIAERLKQGKFLVNPQVTVAVLQTRSRQVSVLGLVSRPGRYALEGESARLTDLIALAGGLQPTAADTVTVVQNRDGKTEKLEVDLPLLMQGGDPGKNIEVQNGDTIFVHRAPVFYIYGEIQRAGAYRVEPGLTVMQALSLAGGITPRGTDRRPQLRRRAPSGEWKESTASLFDAVRADDVIYIRESLF